MNIFEYKLDDEIYIPDLIYNELNNKNICFFDIETTGLSSKYCEIILIGVLCLEGDNVYIKQFFADKPSEEFDILSLFNQFIDKFEYIVSYNGKSFDIPFLKSRLKYHNISSKIDDIDHLDLLQIVRKNKNLLSLENCKLKTVEKSLNIDREDTISGKDSVVLYKAYTRSRDFIKRDIILKHNYDDILYLPRLLSIYDLIEKETLIVLKIVFKDIPIELKLNKDSIKFEQSTLSILASSSKLNLPLQIHYKDIYSLNWDTSRGIFNLELFYKIGKLSNGFKCIYIDLNDIDTNLVFSEFNNLSENIPDNIVLLKIDKHILYDNISSLIKNILLTL